jgi:arylsulfatase A-like enzyme
LFAEFPAWRPPSFNERDVSDKPAWIQRLPLLTEIEQKAGDLFHRKQLQSLQPVDRGLRKIIEALSRSGRLDNVVILFTSDNGLMWGEHRLAGQKGCPYEECLRVPLVIRAAGIARAVNPSFALNVDIMPTILDFAGIPASPGIQGDSLKPVLEGATTGWRNDFLFEHFGALAYEGVRTPRWKYVRYRIGKEELYDLANDPFELDNHGSHRSYASIVRSLRARLEELRVDR